MNGSVITRYMTNKESVNWADEYVDQIKEEINKIRKNIKKNEDVEIIVPLENGINIIPNWFGYHNPNLIIVKGFDHNSNPTTLLIPRTKFTVMLSVIKKETNKKKKVYGFQASKEADE